MDSAQQRPTPSQPRTVSPWVAAFPIVMGAYCAGIGLGWVPHDPAKVHAPGWVIVTCGLAFISAGLALLSMRWSRDGQPQAIFGFAILLGLTLVCNWVAFGPGERHFTAGTSINGTSVASGPVDERSGRIAFGIAAVICDLLLIAGTVRMLRSRQARP